MRKKHLLFTAAVLFIVVNALLVGFDKEKKVPRIAYIKDWAAAEVKDLHEKYEAEGIVRYGDAFHVYFDDRAGNFNEFLVQEGETVHTGDPLFSYFVRDFAETKATLEQKTDALEREITAIETAIQKAKTYQAESRNDQGAGFASTSSSDPADTGFGAEQQLLQEQMDRAEPGQVAAMLEQYVIEKEKELEQKEAQADGIRKQLAALSASGDTITVESPHGGKVTQVSKQLQDPLITIHHAEDLQLAGEITETERMQTEEGMDVIAVIKDSGKKMETALSTVSEVPTDTKVDGLSMYPFRAELDEADAADLLPGYHAQLEIVTKTSRHATAVPEQAAYRGAVWQMTVDGKLTRQKAEKGITEKGYTEVEQAVEPGDWVAVSPKNNFRHRTPFITPLKVTELSLKELREDKRSNLKYVITGLLSR